MNTFLNNFLSLFQKLFSTFYFFILCTLSTHMCAYTQTPRHNIFQYFSRDSSINLITFEVQLLVLPLSES